MGLMNDISQDSQITRLERRMRRMERKLSCEMETEGKGMSRILKELAGKECIIDGDLFYKERCTICDMDDEWVRILVHHKKTADEQRIVRVDSIDSVTLVQGDE